MFHRNSLIFLSILQACVKFGLSFEILNLREGAECFMDHQTGVCKSILECEKPCSEKLSTEFLICGYLSNGVPTVCCTVPRNECAEYKEYACTVTHAGNIRDGPLITVKSPECPFKVRPVIVGGEEAIRKEFPHMALIGYVDVDTVLWGCGGTLISEQFVLTAAHCVDTVNGKAKFVRLGEHDLSQSDEANPIEYNVSEWVQHPKYTSRKNYYDIGLLKLDQVVTFNNAIRPACLPEHLITADKAIATGWGDVSPQIMSNILMKATLDIFPQNKCIDFYETVFGDCKMRLNVGINEMQVCAGSVKDMNNTCPGDSGGPLQIYHEFHYCSYTVIGVTSFGNGCQTNGSSSVYTRVYPFLSWIENIVWPKPINMN